MTVPKVETHLPELVQFVRQLASDVQHGTLTGWEPFSERVRAFYTPPMMSKIEGVLPGWGHMASFADEQTLIHVTSVLVALHLFPEYQQATTRQQSLMTWMVLFHDIAKEAQPGKHDYVHAFRSAAVAGKALAHIGFPVTAAYPTLVDTWSQFTHDAVIFHEGHQENIQDNRHLPDIVAGLDRLFGKNEPAIWVIKPVLLHLSIITDPGYPTVAPLADAEIPRYVDADLYPFMRTMMLVDADGWATFDPDMRERYRQPTLAVFDRIAAQLGISSKTKKRA